MATLLSHPDAINTWSIDVPSRMISASMFLRGLDYSDNEHHTIPVPVGEDPEESDEAENAIKALTALVDLYAFFTSNTMMKTSEVNGMYEVWRINYYNEVLEWLMPDEDMVWQVETAMTDFMAMPVEEMTKSHVMEGSMAAPFDMKELDESWIMGSDV